MPLTHIQAWDDLIRRAKAAGINVPFNHAGVAVLTMPPPEPAPVPPPPAAASAAPDAASS